MLLPVAWASHVGISSSPCCSTSGAVNAPEKAMEAAQVLGSLHPYGDLAHEPVDGRRLCLILPFK